MTLSTTFAPLCLLKIVYVCKIQNFKIIHKKKYRFVPLSVCLSLILWMIHNDLHTMRH